MNYLRAHAAVPEVIIAALAIICSTVLTAIGTMSAEAFLAIVMAAGGYGAGRWDGRRGEAARQLDIE